jgi:hypothetical protein
MVLVGHWTLNDCAVAGSAATPMTASTKVLTILIDMRSPPIRLQHLPAIGSARCPTSSCTPSIERIGWHSFCLSTSSDGKHDAKMTAPSRLSACFGWIEHCREDRECLLAKMCQELIGE